MTSIQDPQNLGVGPRVAAFLRGAYSRDRAKRIARDFRVSPQTAERWLAGHAPTVAHIEAMVAQFGRPFIAALFVEACQEQEQRIAALEAELARMRAEAERAKAAVPVPGERERLRSSRVDRGDWVEVSDLLRGLLAALDPVAYPPPELVFEPPPVRRGWLARLLPWAARESAGAAYGR